MTDSIHFDIFVIVMKTADIKRRALAIVDKYYDVARDQVLLKGMAPTLENIFVEMINMHYKRVVPMDHLPLKRTTPTK